MLSARKLESIYHEYKDYLWRLFFRLTGDADDAYDLVQAVFLKLMQTESIVWERLNKSYLYRIGYNLFIDEYRKKIKHSEKLEEYIASKQEETYSEESFKYEIIKQKIEKIQLKERTRTILKMRLFGGLTPGRISILLGVSKRTVFRELNLGVELLKESISQEEMLKKNEL
ncbi:MAG: RNA polymerase sigma factor [Spirochaetota bacterium]